MSTKNTSEHGVSETRSSEIGMESARASLRERCLSLVRRWQPLACSGWDHRAARELGDELEHIMQISDELALDSLNTSALELAAYLCSFIDDHLQPNSNDLQRLAGMVNALGNELSLLSGSVSAEIRTLHAEPLPPAHASPTASSMIRSEAAPTSSVLRDSRQICLFGSCVSSVPGLASALAERAYQSNEYESIEELLRFLDHTLPGALLLDASALRHLDRIRLRLSSHRSDIEAMPAILVFSSTGDLSDRLLAMRAGAAALFSVPHDCLRILATLDELLQYAAQTPWRALLVEADRNNAVERARSLAERGMTVRLAHDAEAALAALQEFRPDAIVIDPQLPDSNGIELIQMLRQQPGHATLPILLMADESDIAQRFDAIAAGSDEVLLKPVRARHLSSALLSRLKRAQTLRDLLGAAPQNSPQNVLQPRARLLQRLETMQDSPTSALLCVGIDHADELRAKIGLGGLGMLDTHIGNLLRPLLNAADIAVQHHDFQYLLLAQRTSAIGLTALAEKIRAQVMQSEWTLRGELHTLSASIGLVALRGVNSDVDTMVARTHAAQQIAQSQGGNQIHWAQDDDTTQPSPDPLLSIAALLGRPLRSEQAEFLLQPIVPLAGRLKGQFELKFGLHGNPQLGRSISYAELAAAADTRQIIHLDRWLLQHTLQMREEQLKRGRQLRVFVPQSVRSLMADELPWWIEHELKQRHLSGTGLTLTVSASALVDTGEAGRARLRQLRALGVRICAEEFGRDWAAVHALKDMELDFMRLDSSLIEELGSAPGVAGMLKELTRRAHVAGAAVIAAQVDSVADAHELLRLGVDYSSGMAFSAALATPEYDFDRALW
ncbi:MAG: EAL domain-containing protein [Dokdonella sp.]